MRSDATRPRIALFGNFGTGNLGNEATLQAMVHNLRRRLPNAEITCICPGPDNAASLHNISAIPIRALFPIWKLTNVSNRNVDRVGASNGSISGSARWAKTFVRLRAPLRICAYPFIDAYRWFKGFVRLKGSKILVMTGTGMLGEYSIGPFDLHYDLFRWAVIAKLCRCKLLFVSVGGGPIRHPLSKFFVRVALTLADYRSYRDASSKDHLEAIGVHVTNDAVYPDLAFSLPGAVMPVNQGPARQGIVIGVGLMNYHNRFGRYRNDEPINRDYVGGIASFVVRLLERGYTVRVLIGDFVWDQGVRRDLRRELEERGCNYEGGMILDEPASSVEELLSQLASVDVVVSSRFHNVLLGLMLGKPAIAISYHEKFRPLMNGLGLDEFCCDIEHIDVDELIGKVVKLVENTPDIKGQIALRKESYRAALNEQYVRILESISSG